MPNNLTGDFDVVAQFAVPAVNRLLAAMHSVERFPHSLAVRIDDLPPSDDRVSWPSLSATVDSFGEAVADHGEIGDFVPPSGGVFEGSPHGAFDSIVNPGANMVAEGTVEPSNLKGRAQLQISPPLISIADTSGDKVSVKMKLIARYFPDPGTPPLAEFVRGELTITAAVNQVASQVGNIVDIDIKSNTTIVDFVAQWSSTPLSAQDRAGLNLFIRNAIRTSFLPSNSRLPPNIIRIQFKTLSIGSGTVAVMLNLGNAVGNAASVTNVFLAGADGFAFGVGADFIRGALQPAIDAILSTPVEPVKFKIESFIHTWNVTYDIALDDASMELENGGIVFIVHGRARTGTSWLPNFSFTTRQTFTLQVSGPVVSLVVGTTALDTSSWIADRFRGGAIASMRQSAERALDDSNARETVGEMLSAESILGQFIDSLLKPARNGLVTGPRLFRLAYTEADIGPDGIVLHGDLSVTAWAAPHAEYELIKSGGRPGNGPHASVGALDGPDYSALNSWIPGGTVESYEWKRQAQTQPGPRDANTFVHLHQGPQATVASADATVSAFSPLCVTVRGTRLTSSGAVSAQAVSATRCGFNRFPILDGTWSGAQPLIALASPGPDGNVVVHGHTQPGSVARGRSPNLIVNFATATSDDVAAISRAVRESGRDDAPVAIVMVAGSERLGRTRYVEGVTYSEDRDGAWSKRFDIAVSREPATLIVDPSGKVVWTHKGALESAALGEALKKSLVRGGPVRATFGRPNVRVGHPPPNFLFEHAPGRELTLRKLRGKPAVLVFSRNSSETLAHAVREIDAARISAEGVVTLVIGGDDASESKRERSGGQPGSAILVKDPAGQIAAAYGITMWPTIISLDSLGLVRGIRYGTGTGDNSTSERSSK